MGNSYVTDHFFNQVIASFLTVNKRVGRSGLFAPRKKFPIILPIGLATISAHFEKMAACSGPAKCCLHSFVILTTLVRSHSIGSGLKFSISPMIRVLCFPSSSVIIVLGTHSTHMILSGVILNLIF